MTNLLSLTGMVKQFVQDRKHHASICLHKKNICKNKISGYFVHFLGVTFMWTKENFRPQCWCICYIWQQCTHTIAGRLARIWSSSFSALSSCFHSPLDVQQSFNQQIQFMLYGHNSCFQILHFWDLLPCYEVFIFSTLLIPFGICFSFTTDIASCWMHQIRLDSPPGKFSSSPSWHHPINILVRKSPCQQGK